MAIDWQSVRSYEDITYDQVEGIARLAINRPEVRNAFRPQTVMELIDAFSRVREDPAIGVVILTGTGTDAFCSGGDQRVRGEQGYVGSDGVPRLNVLDLQRMIRSLPKPVVAMVAGYAIGGGHVLHLVCDLTIGHQSVCVAAARMRCQSCGAEFYMPGQMDAAQQLATAHMRADEGAT